MNNSEQIKRFIFTGTPGSGKTSVIQELEKLGHIIISESATDVIAQEQAKGSMRPWEGHDFIDKIIALQKQRQAAARGDVQFYDRSPFCVYALGRYLSSELTSNFIPSSILQEEIDRCIKYKIYQNKIFFFENLGFIESTHARKISYEDALVFEQMHLDVYKEFGFEIVLVPKRSIEERCQFVLEISGIKK